jgi:predicted nuclease of predicted toxin-antitoxin system
VKLLFDENLSPSLVRRLADLFPEAAHVPWPSRADDATILNYARDNDYVVVTKDADYRALRLSFGKPVPRVAWIRLGNGATTMIEQVLRSRARAIEALTDDETGIIDIL